jgi:hypothetical protein
MNAMNKDVDDWIGAARPPAPSAALRERVLAVARATAVQEAGVVDRIWESRRVRWGWALVVLILLLGHVVLSGSHGPDRDVPSPRAQASRLRMIDVILDPSVARSLLEEAP